MGAEARQVVQAVVGAARELALGVEERRGESVAAVAPLQGIGVDLYFYLRAPTRDATFTCSLSNFDAYLVTRIQNAPKPFTFPVKSVDNLNLFERAADYHHVFSCSVGDGLIWLEEILLARVSVQIGPRIIVILIFYPAVTLPARTSGIIYQYPELSSHSKID